MAELGYDHEYNINPFLFHKDEYDNRLLKKRVNKQYQIIEEISQLGAFGIVHRARDTKTNETVAIKEMVHGLSEPALTEIEILKSLPRHPNIVAFKKVAMEGARVFVVMEYLEYDLKRLRVANGKPFSLEEIKYLMKEILKGIGFLHDNGVVHRDLKPSNILFGVPDHEVKICDFGMSGKIGSACHGGGVGTSGYVAPEVLVGSSNTNFAIDMWSVGCIMAELVLDQPLFRGRSEDQQLKCINNILCSPGNLLRLWMSTFASFLGATHLTLSGHDLLERLLAYDPMKRVSAKDALDHAWFKEILQ